MGQFEMKHAFSEGAAGFSLLNIRATIRALQGWLKGKCTGAEAHAEGDLNSMA